MCLSSVLNWINTCRRYILSACICGIAGLAFSQSQVHDFTSSVSFRTQISLPSLPDTLTREESKSGAFVFAYPFAVNYRLSDLTPILRGDSVYYAMQIVSPQAYSLNLIFEDVYFSKHARLSLYGTDSVDFVTYTIQELGDAHCLATPLIQGDTLYVDFVTTRDEVRENAWTITQVAHDYTDVLHKESSLLKSTSSSCNVDINCSEGSDWQTEKRAVCKMLIQGVSLCTGTLISNTAKDNTPYVLTANHCVASDAKALKTVFYFGYENEECGKSATVSSAKTISGSTLIATSPDGKLDFTLLQLSSTPPKSYNPYYAGWSLSESIAKGTACIHHPKGDVKKISIDADAPKTATFKQSGFTYVTDGHWKISEWDVGTTEGGSSGSGLLNADHLLIGTLSGGEADCETPVNDFFSKLSKAWDYYDASTARLKPWLDPLNLGETSCSGFDPYLLASNVLSNVWFTDTLFAYDFSDKADGQWAGSNDMGWTAFAERFVTTKSVYDIVIGGVVDETLSLDDVVVCVWQGTSEPEEEIFSVALTESMIQADGSIHVVPSEPIESPGLCWVGYRIANRSRAFHAYITEAQDAGAFFIKHPRGWVNTTTVGFPAHMAALLHVTTQPDTLSTIAYEKPFFIPLIQKDTIASKVTDELFGIDSLGTIRENVSYVTLSNASVSNMAGPNEIGSNCFANLSIIDSPVWVRSLKIGVADVPDVSLMSDVYFWNSDMSEIVYRQSVSNADLYPRYFNQINLDSLLYFDQNFTYGVCLDTAHYDQNLSLLQYYDTDSRVEACFRMHQSWIPYKKFSIPYNVALQPIIAKTQYHFNPDSAIVERYPLSPISHITLESSTEFIVYPTICTHELHVYFYKNIYTNADIQIQNLRGEIVSTNTYVLAGSSFTIPVSQLPAGNFIVTVTVDGKTQSALFIHVQ